MPPADSRANRWGWLESLALAVYAGIAGTGVWFHEAWADEAQAWLVARDMGWWSMMLRGVRYEGTPGLWHCLLWLLIRLHVSFQDMHWFAAACAALGVVVLLRWAPFPRPLRLLLPFTFFLAYQDCVVARSYVLFAVMAFGAAALLRLRARAPGQLWLLALLLGLMANLSLHCFLASLALAVVAYRRNLRARGPALLLAGCWAIAVATALPPPDVAFPAGKNIDESWKKVVATVEHRRYTAPAPVILEGELSPIPPPVHHRTSMQNVERKVGRLLALLSFPLSSVRWLGLAVALLFIVHGSMLRKGSAVGPLGLVPYLLPGVFFLSLYLAPRHAGFLFESFLVMAWLTWPDRAGTRWARVLTVALLLITLEQIGWTAHALISDIKGPYSGDRMTSEFLRNHAAGKRVAGFYYHSVSVLPYIKGRGPNLYFNQHPEGYWDWSRANRTDPQAPLAWRTHPDYVVVAGYDWGDNPEITSDWPELGDGATNTVPLGDEYGVLPWFKAHGYHETHRFCGHAWMRFGYAELLCDVVLEPAPEAAAGTAPPGSIKW